VRCKSPGGVCICGEHSFELGRVFGAHLLVKSMVLVVTDDEVERAIADLLDVLDDAETRVRARELEKRTASRGRVVLQ
jgi:hypothetical protein